MTQGPGPRPSIWNVPNTLTLSRLPLSALLFWLIHERWWMLALAVFVVTSITDWLDGWWARKFNQLSAFGRTFDPLIDKVMTGGAFIFFIRVPELGIDPWMATVVIGRELLITGIRGYIEASGFKFGADWFGKLKMVLQCVVIIVALVYMIVATNEGLRPGQGIVEIIYLVCLYAMLAATILSGLQYCWKASKLMKS